ncbi:hypothetical protein BpHYR1_000703 [Brachionus plicatilis]|uniref:Uncharacterized protein n=1 Tax=Brachionus plicatilis TaxID=10195 RepID=A0A3M7T6F4_BRAPC|nr:hypothetical protein BpHYR1_000703 [Brachionus plicatilis]
MNCDKKKTHLNLDSYIFITNIEKNIRIFSTFKLAFIFGQNLLPGTNSTREHYLGSVKINSPKKLAAARTFPAPQYQNI